MAKNRTLGCAVDADTYDVVVAQATQSGMSTSDWLRNKISSGATCVQINITNNNY